MVYYRKIDIFIDGKYECSTTWSKTCKEAVQRYKEKEDLDMYGVNIKARYAENV